VGVNHLIELLAFQSTITHPSASEIVSRMDTLGGSTFASSSREQLMYCVDILRPSVEEATELLASTILTPLITQEEVSEMKQVMEYQMQDMIPELKMGEGMHVAAYKGSQLGRTHFCPPDNISHLNAEMVHEFRAQHFAAKDMVLAGAGIEHERLVELGHKYFSSLPATEGSSQVAPSKYVGGDYRLEAPTVDGFTRVAMACEVGGWHSDDLVPTCVLQILLGGGSSFSAGGPGKGMYSRLYREVLNRFYWAESAEAFTSFHSETGLLGISGSSKPDKSRDLTRVIAEHFAKLTVEHVTDEELDRARKMLKCNVLTQLESRLVLFEDIGRQILTYGHREDTVKMCAKIDAVTKEEIMELARRAFFNSPPTLAAVGDDLSNVPKYDEFLSWFNN
jgi:processing peptidase subunit alpha